MVGRRNPMSDYVKYCAQAAMAALVVLYVGARVYMLYLDIVLWVLSLPPNA
jgi:hypothetical protein